MVVPPTLLATLGLGFSLGLLHALDADHLVAVTNMVSDRPSPRRSVLVGMLWGCGHALALGAVALAVIAFGWVVPASFATWAELAVAGMLVLLGAQTIRRGLGDAVVHVHMHEHEGVVHAHRHLHVGHGEHHRGPLHVLAHAGRRPFVVGLVHGVAGSAALTVLVLSRIASPVVALAYVVVFGLGSIGAMGIMSAIVALPLAAARAAARPLEVAIGIGGVVFGGALALRLLVG